MMCQSFRHELPVACRFVVCSRLPAHAPLRSFTDAKSALAFWGIKGASRYASTECVILDHFPQTPPPSFV